MEAKDRVEGRQCFLDILRVAATCAVVLLHTVTGVMDATDMSVYPLEKKVFLVALDLITWCVPVFLLISGYLFLNPNREVTFKQMLKKYCRRIVYALLLFGIPYACLEQIMAERTFRVQMLWESVRLVLQGKTWSHMWYLYLILFLYLITPALKTILKKTPKWAVYIALTVLFVGSSLVPYVGKLCNLTDIPALTDNGIYLFYYLCGYLFSQPVKAKEDSDGGMPPKWLKYTVGGAAALLCGGMACSRLVGSYSVQMAYNYPFTVALALLLMWGARGAELQLRKKNTTLWGKAGALSFGVYLIHPVFVNFLYKFLHITPLSFSDGQLLPIGLSLPLFYAVVLLLSVFAAWVLDKIPGMRKYVL